MCAAMVQTEYPHSPMCPHSWIRPRSTLISAQTHQSTCCPNMIYVVYSKVQKDSQQRVVEGGEQHTAHKWHGFPQHLKKLIRKREHNFRQFKQAKTFD